MVRCVAVSIELDPAAVDRVLHLGGRELLLRLVPTARENMRGRLDEIEAAAAEEPPDFVRIERAAHSLKSSAAYVGAKELRALALSMEVLASQFGAEDPVVAEESAAEEDGTSAVGAETETLLSRTREVFAETLVALEELERRTR